MIGDEEFDEFDDEKSKGKGLTWMESLMEKFLILLTVASLILFFIMIVF
jgi:hypothetical protein